MELQKLKDIAVNMMMQYGEIPQLVFVETATKTAIIPVPLTDPEMKHEEMMIAGFVTAKALGDRAKTVSAVGFVTEAWMSRFALNEIAGKQIPSPTQDPNRIECLLISIMEIPSRKTQVCTVEMKRKGKLLELVDTPESSNPDEVKSEIIEAFVKGLLKGVK
jgi:hypothetical protein